MKARLEIDNPWWDTGVIPTSSSVLTPRVFLGSLLARLAPGDPTRPTVISGGRGVGKTVLLHHAIAALLGRGVPARRIVYLGLRAPSFARAPIVDLVERAPEREGDGPTYLILDNVERRPGWRDEVAALPTPTVVLAASALKSPPPHHDIVMPPLTFYEYLHAVDADLAANADPDMAAIAALNDRFLDYANEGAHPAPAGVSGSERLRRLADAIGDTLLGSDLPQRAGIADTAELMRTFVTIAERTASETGIEELAKATAFAKNTVRRHLEFLERAHLIVRLPRVDGAAAPFQRAVTFKAHLTSAAFRAALFGRAEAGDAAIESLAETALLGQWLHSASAPRLCYARWREGGTERQVDLACVDAGRRLPLWALDATWSNRSYADAEAIAGLAAFAAASPRPFPHRITTRTLRGTKTVGACELSFVPAAVYAFNLVRDFVAAHPA